MYLQNQYYKHKVTNATIKSYSPIHPQLIRDNISNKKNEYKVLRLILSLPFYQTEYCTYFSMFKLILTHIQRKWCEVGINYNRNLLHKWVFQLHYYLPEWVWFLRNSQGTYKITSLWSKKYLSPWASCIDSTNLLFLFWKKNCLSFPLPSPSPLFQTYSFIFL